MLTNEEKGRKGGLSRSDRKRASSRENLRKARVKRYPGRELAAQATEDARLEQEWHDARELDAIEHHDEDMAALAEVARREREEHASDIALLAEINKELGFNPELKGPAARRRLFNVEFSNPDPEEDKDEQHE